MSSPNRPIVHSADRGKEEFDAKSLRSMVGSAMYALLNSTSAVPAFLRFNAICSRSDLQAGTGAYQNYYFAGNNPVFPQGSHARGDVSMFLDQKPIQDICERSNGPLFDAVSAIRERMEHLVRAYVTHTQVDLMHQQAFYHAYLLAQAQGKKLVLLGTHQSHFDALAYELAISVASRGAYGLNFSGVVRFLCGAYMYYNPSVRPYTAAHNSLFVFGPHDAKRVTNYLMGKDPSTEDSDVHKPFTQSTTDGGEEKWTQTRPPNREGVRYLGKLRDRILAAYGERPEEILVVFPYAGRGTGAHKPFGIKNAVPPEILKQLSHPNALYLPVALAGTDALMESGRRYGIFGPINAYSRGPIRLAVGEPIPGEQMNLEALHRQMCRLSYNNLKAFRDANGKSMPGHIPDDIGIATGLHTPHRGPVRL